MTEVPVPESSADEELLVSALLETEQRDVALVSIHGAHELLELNSRIGQILR